MHVFALLYKIIKCLALCKRCMLLLYVACVLCVLRIYVALCNLMSWMMGKPAAFGCTVTSPLTSSNLPEVSVTAGSAAFAAEERKHKANNSKCAELGLVCIPIAVETYGCWGTEALLQLA